MIKASLSVFVLILLWSSFEHSDKSFYKLRNIILYLLLLCRALFIITFDMETTQFRHSAKNIPIPLQHDYSKISIEKIEQPCKRMRWKAYFYLNPEVSNNNRETYEFNSKNTPPHIPELESFENRLLDMIHNVKFKNVNVKCGYQKKLSNDVKNIKKSAWITICAR